MVSNHKARYNNDRDIEIFGRMEPGDRSDDPKIADIMPYARRNGIFKDKYFKLENDKVCKTITAHMKFDCNMYIHPTQARGLTPREAARVQSYPCLLYTSKHYISFIAAASSDRMQMVKLYPEGNAEARFKINGVKRIFFYCNKDGLFSINVVKGLDDREKSYDDVEERRELEKVAGILFR